MFCTTRKWCDFVVQTNIDIHIERIGWDSQLWETITSKLQHFYFAAILPELSQPQHPSTATIRKPADCGLTDENNFSQKFL